MLFVDNFATRTSLEALLRFLVPYIAADKSRSGIIIAKFPWRINHVAREVTNTRDASANIRDNVTVNARRAANAASRLRV